MIRADRQMTKWAILAIILIVLLGGISALAAERTRTLGQAATVAAAKPKPMQQMHAATALPSAPATVDPADLMTSCRWEKNQSAAGKYCPKQVPLSFGTDSTRCLGPDLQEAGACPPYSAVVAIGAHGNMLGTTNIEHIFCDFNFSNGWIKQVEVGSPSVGPQELPDCRTATPYQAPAR
jgi:hypothetical protein